MAISTKDPVLIWRQVRGLVRGAMKPQSQLVAEALFTYLAQQGSNPDLQFVPFDYLTGSNTVIADAACKIYAIFLKKATTTAAWFKGSDSASTGSSTAAEVMTKLASVCEAQLLYPNGLAMANGFTVISNTTASGNTTTAAGDGAKGFVLLGAP